MSTTLGQESKTDWASLDSDEEVQRISDKVNQLNTSENKNEDQKATNLSDRLGPKITENVDAKSEQDKATNTIAEDANTKQSENDESNLIPNKNEVRVKLADLQADPNSPLFSVKSFEELELKPELLKGIYSMKFQKPSKIQEKALPLLLSNPPRNMIGQSQSGTGKTAAFALTMLSRVDASVPKPQAICLAPSRELARQIMDVVTEMGKYTEVKTAFGIKDSVPKGAKIDAQIVIGTPGTVMDLMKRRQLDARDIKVFVLDEADNMLDQQGLGDQSMRIKHLLPRNTQIVLFSATFSERVEKYAERFAPNANEIRLKTEELSVEGIKQLYMDCQSEEHKYNVLVELYGLLTIGQSIIFCKKKDTAEEIARRMTADGHTVACLTGNLEGAQRDAIMDSFRVGTSKVLVTTNVIARGIDVSQVNLVVNYDMPLDQAGRPDPQTYLHRIGRTGRFGRVGVSINFVHDKKSWEEMNAIQEYFQRPITRVPTDDYEELEKVVKNALKM
ncbi:ATP-dependent RNA helicase dbp5 [Schizosaccharomyces pombe]|uniref:ATP-dependent RNA helicase dbp5 n=1 Tax=Schizosaccharomyces pombe (strain 972 / ATCC 24843) TaxID=284812 RepID=DBP5_SCHPO|nr:putative ATP-dependent RNA helicase Dbp5 [Schizosaccharomyces pombe]Q09747.1 RecName: Full=ATP-dependent RNA helicase dbp5 [Schizosaccharomyces pombe 972h-]CAA90819.1 cytoplasmic ATP-dependent RNA helicase Dbp5 (predicted) [Schizosaccharomyces pombe]|eukprot:NP_596016.1 putative ATP-dependent RNA helicase Dbp5 [Schizosaccharomyces pombe]